MYSFKILAIALAAAISSPVPKQKPLSHRLIAQDKGHVAMVRGDGKVEWEIDNPFVSHDLGVLPNGNFLLHTGPATITEVTPEKKIVWEYTSKPQAPYTGI